MTLPAPRPARHALLPLALAVACASLALPALGQGLQTSFERGEPAPLAGKQALQVEVGGGPRAPYAAKPGVGYSGLRALHYTGSGGTQQRRLFNTDVTIEADTTLSWLVLPEIVGTDTVASTYVSLDLLLDDGSRVSASDARDQHGSALGAAAQGDSKTLYPQQWHARPCAWARCRRCAVAAWWRWNCRWPVRPGRRCRAGSTTCSWPRNPALPRSARRTGC